MSEDEPRKPCVFRFTFTFTDTWTQKEISLVFLTRDVANAQAAAWAELVVIQGERGISADETRERFRLASSLQVPANVYM